MEVTWFAAYRNGGVDADTDEAAEYSRARDAYYAQWKRYHLLSAHLVRDFSEFPLAPVDRCA